LRIPERADDGMAKRDYYEVLELTKGATEADI